MGDSVVAVRSAPRLSVVIPTLGRPILVQTLNSLVQANGFECIEVFVAGQINDPAVMRDVTQLKDQYPQIRHLPISFPIGDSSEKKSAGFRQASAEIVAFIDDDVVIATDWPEKILEAFNDPQVAFVTGPSLVPDHVPLIARLTGVTLASKAAGYVADRYLASGASIHQVKWSRIMGCNMAFRKSVMDQMGPFDPQFYPGEEMIYSFKATRAGHKLFFCPAARLWHYPRSTFVRFWGQVFGYGATRIRLYRAGVDFEWATVVPAFWVLSLILLGLASPFWWQSALLLVLDLGLYFASAAWITLEKFRETREKRDLLMIVLIPVMHLSYGLGEWKELFWPNQDFSVRSRKK